MGCRVYKVQGLIWTTIQTWRTLGYGMKLSGARLKSAESSEALAFCFQPVKP